MSTAPRGAREREGLLLDRDALHALRGQLQLALGHCRLLEQEPLGPESRRSVETILRSVQEIIGRISAAERTIDPGTPSQ